MIKKVVDTNVAVVANGRDTQASVACRQACVAKLVNLRDRGKVVIDAGGSILAEYGKRLRPEGQPGVGDLFYRHVLDNRGNPRSVISVGLNNERAERLRDAFQRGSLSQFDNDDQVFAITALVSRASVATAVDSDWVQHESGLRACGVDIEFVCGREAARRGG